jgi:recombination protein RecA
VDSVAALTPKAELEGEIGDIHVAQQARLMSQAMRILCAEAGSRGITIFWTNQLREKIGICFEYHVPVLLEDGTSEWIGRIVNQKKNVKVMSYDLDTGFLVPKKVKRWVHNGTLPKGESFVRIHVKGMPGSGRGGQRGITVTKSHRIFTPTGERLAEDIQVGDKVLVNDWQYFTPEHHELILGSILGDGGLRFEKGSPRGHIRFLHCKEQTEYCSWKASCFGLSIHRGNRGVVWFDTMRTQELEEYQSIGKKKAIRSLPLSFVSRLTPKAVAIWYQDDGNYSGSHKRWGWGKCSISARCLTKNVLDAIAIHLQNLGMGMATAREGRGLQWNGDNSRQFQQVIAPFVHPSMRYKIKKDMPSFSWKLKPIKPILRGYARVVTKKELWTPPLRRKSLFDLEIEGHHSYVAGGIIVHNSYGDRTTTPGGHALRHYASIRVNFTAIQKLKSGDEVIGSKIKADVKKNKCAAPFKKAEFYISFGTGIDRIAAVCDAAIVYKVVKKKGNSIYLPDPADPKTGQILGKGRLDFIKTVKNDQKLFDSLTELIKNAPLPEAQTEAPAEGETEGEPETDKKIKKPKGGLKRVPVLDDDALPDGGGTDDVEVTEV